MAATNFAEYFEDFFGVGDVAADAVAGTLLVEDGGGSESHGYAEGHGGQFALGLDVAAGASLVRLSGGDAKNFDPTKISEMRVRFKSPAALAAGTTLAIGLCNANNADVSAITQFVGFRIGETSSGDIAAAATDGTNTTAPYATGRSVEAGKWHELQVSIATGTGDVRMFVDGQPVLGATFNISQAGDLQPVIQLQKASGAAADIVAIDYVGIRSKR